MVKVDYSGAESFFTKAGPDYALAALAHKTLAEKSGLGADFTGWTELPQRIKDTELDAIVAAAELIRSRSRALVVIGIGGSYLGARGAIELLKPRPGKGDPKVFFMGNTLSVDALNDTIDALGDMDFDVNVISKSGTTLEPAVSFRIFRELLHKKYGADADKHIFATTDARRGVLKSLADQSGWPCFVVPDDVGGRFSVLSAVGLLPMAVAGIDVRKVIDAAIEELKALDLRSPENPAWQYAAARQHLYQKGYGPRRASTCTRRATAWRSWAATSPASASWPSGGSSSTARARARTARASSPPAWSSPPTCTPWASTSSRVPGC